MKNLLLVLCLLVCTILVSAQAPKTSYTPHVVFDDNNKVYAVKMGSSTFLKFIDSTGTFYTKNVTNGKDYFGKGHTARIVPAGQETTYATKAEAQALLDYWNQIQMKKEMNKPKAPKYSD